MSSLAEYFSLRSCSGTTASPCRCLFAVGCLVPVKGRFPELLLLLQLVLLAGGSAGPLLLVKEGCAEPLLMLVAGGCAEPLLLLLVAGG